MATLQIYNTVQKYSRKVKPLSIGCTHVTDDRQTDGFAIALAERNVERKVIGSTK